MQDLVLLLSCVLLLSAGFLAPFVMTLAYVWVDTFVPQLVSNGTLSSIPIALLFGSLAVVTYFVKDRKDPPRFNVQTGLMLALVAWMTLTLLWARNPQLAFDRWSDVVKVVLFSVFIPYSFRTRVHIEAFVLVYLFSIAGHLMPWGIKTFLTGGGYGLSLGLLRSNSSSLAESSTMAGVGFMFVPLLLVVRKHSLFFPRGRLVDLGAAVMIVVGMVASIGTFARTSLVALAIMGTSLWIKSKRKIVFTLGAVLVLGILFSVTSDRWTARISTVNDYQSDESAMGRIIMWRWSWEFAQSHPEGGGFQAYIGNIINVPGENGQAATTMFARAYHNIFFSALADLGYPGLILYTSILGVAFAQARAARRMTHNLPGHEWCGDLAQAVQVSLLTMLATGFFVDFSYSPLLWYLLCMCSCLRNYALRVTAKTRLASPKRIMEGMPDFAGPKALGALPAQVHRAIR